MRKHIFTTLLSTAVIFASLSLGSYQAQAATARIPLSKLSSQGFRNCKSFDRQGKSAWTAVVRGTSLDSNTRVDSQGFSLRNCFSSQSQCQQFINNIRRIVSNVDYIRYKSCKPR